MRSSGPDSRWHDRERRFFWPQWTRPDGVAAGLIWKTGANEVRTCRFRGERLSFVDETGRIVRPANPSKGVYTLVLGERPIFFTGGAFEGFAETASADYVEVALLDVVQH